MASSNKASWIRFLTASSAAAGLCRDGSMPGLTQARPPGRQAESCRVLPAQVRPEGSFLLGLPWNGSFRSRGFDCLQNSRVF